MKKVLKFAATWCQPCKNLSETMKDVETDVVIEEIDIDEDDNKAIQFNVRSVPTLVMLEDDKEVNRIMGNQSKQELEVFLNG